MLTELATQTKVVGAKQVKRAVEAGQALRVYLAEDADPRVTDPVRELCQSKGTAVVEDITMRELGKACGIAVGAAVAALLG